jgi:hypothetical protein
MAGSQMQNTQHGRWDEATRVAVGLVRARLSAWPWGADQGIAIGVARGAGVGVAVAAWRTHHGSGANT